MSSDRANWNFFLSLKEEKAVRSITRRDHKYERIHTLYHNWRHPHESNIVLNRLELAWWIRITPGCVCNCSTIDGEVELALCARFLEKRVGKVLPLHRANQKSGISFVACGKTRHIRANTTHSCGNWNSIISTSVADQDQVTRKLDESHIYISTDYLRKFCLSNDGSFDFCCSPRHYRWVEDVEGKCGRKL